MILAQILRRAREAGLSLDAKRRSTAQLDRYKQKWALEAAAACRRRPGSVKLARNEGSGSTRATGAVGGSNATCRSDDRRCRNRVERFRVGGLLGAAGPAPRSGTRRFGPGAKPRGRCPASSAAQTRRN